MKIPTPKSLREIALEAAQPASARQIAAVAQEVQEHADAQITFAKFHFKQILGVELDDDAITPDRANFPCADEEKPRIVYQEMQFQAGYFSHNARLQFGRECARCGAMEWQNIGDVAALGIAIQKPQQCAECDENRSLQRTRERYITADGLRVDIEEQITLNKMPLMGLIAYYQARAIVEQTDAINEAAAATYEALQEISEQLKPNVEISLQPDPLTREKMNDFLKSTGLPTMPSALCTVEDLATQWGLKKIPFVGNFRGKNPIDDIKGEGFILEQSGTAYCDITNRQYTAEQVAHAAGIDPAEYDPISDPFANE